MTKIPPLAVCAGHRMSNVGDVCSVDGLGGRWKLQPAPAALSD
jgi:hypothetical protein